MVRQRYAKAAPYILTDLKSGRSLRLSTEAYHVASKMDGSRTLQELGPTDGQEIGNQLVAEVTQTLAAAQLLKNLPPQQKKS